MLVIALLAALAGPDSAPTPDVEARAEALVAQGQLDEALQVLEQAYYADDASQPRLLFGMGMIELQRDDCEAAVGYLGRFLATDPAVEAAVRAQEVIAYCEDQRRAQAELSAQPAVPVVEAEPAPETVEPEMSPTPRAVEDPDPDDEVRNEGAWYRDGLGWGLAGTGIAVTAVGVGLLAQASNDVRVAQRAPDETEFDRSLQRVVPLRVIGGVLTGAGASLLVGAAIRYGVVARRDRRASLAVGVGARAGFIRMTTRF